MPEGHDQTLNTRAFEVVVMIAEAEVEAVVDPTTIEAVGVEVAEAVEVAVEDEVEQGSSTRWHTDC